jgi:hypothetical protein
MTPVQFHGMTDSALDRALFVLFLAFSYSIFKLSRVYFVYALAVGLIPALASQLLSYDRNMIVCFPLFISMAIALKTNLKSIVLWLIVVSMGAIQLYLSVRYVRFEWAG